jgi:hypothetical protein
MNINTSLLTNIFLICVAFSGLSKCRTKNFFKTKRDLSISSLVSDYQPFLELVKPIAVKRVSGTPEIRAVADVFIKFIFSEFFFYLFEEIFSQTSTFLPK